MNQKLYDEKLQRVIRRLDKLDITTQQGERLDKYDVHYLVGSEICGNKSEIAKEILSLFGINEPKNK